MYSMKCVEMQIQFMDFLGFVRRDEDGKIRKFVRFFSLTLFNLSYILFSVLKVKVLIADSHKVGVSKEHHYANKINDMDEMVHFCNTWAIFILLWFQATAIKNTVAAAKEMFRLDYSEIVNKCTRIEILLGLLSVPVMVALVCVGIFIMPIFRAKVGYEENVFWNRTNPHRLTALRLWTPFDSTLTPFYVLMRCASIYYCFSFGFANYFSLTFLTFLRLHMQGQFEMLVRDINTLSAKLKTRREDEKKSLNAIDSGIEFEQELKRDFARIVEHHQVFLRFCYKLQDTLRIYFLISGVYFTVYTSVSILHINLVSTVMDIVFALAEATLALMDTYFFCLNGEVIRTSSLEVYTSIYNFNWHYLPPSLYKTYEIILMRSQNPVDFNLFREFISIGFKTYVKIIKISYSIITFILRAKTID